MAHFVIHDKDGNILRVGNCPDEHMEQQVIEDHEILLPHVQAEPHHKVNVATKEVITEGLKPRGMPPPMPVPKTSNGISDERLRAMIYQVLMEIDAAAKE